MADLNDKDLYESAVSDTPVEKVETPAETPEPTPEAGPARDEAGRFAPKVEALETPAAPAAEAAPAVKADEAHVPSWRLREVNDKAEAAERRAQESETRAQTMERQLHKMQQQFQANQPKQEPVDWYADPNAAFKQNVSPLENQIQGVSTNLNLKVSRVLAVVEHGKETVAEMEKAIDQAMRSGNPEMGVLAAQMRNSEDPVGVAMQWYQRDKLVRETGGDVTAYRNKLLDDSLKDPVFLARALEAAKSQASGQAPGRPNTIVQLPPSINRATSAGSPHDEQGDLTNQSLYAHATR